MSKKELLPSLFGFRMDVRTRTDGLTNWGRWTEYALKRNRIWNGNLNWKLGGQIIQELASCSLINRLVVRSCMHVLCGPTWRGGIQSVSCFAFHPARLFIRSVLLLASAVVKDVFSRSCFFNYFPFLFTSISPSLLKSTFFLIKTNKHGARAPGSNSFSS
jgi:hypothetical protein